MSKRLIDSAVADWGCWCSLSRWLQSRLGLLRKVFVKKVKEQPEGSHLTSTSSIETPGEISCLKTEMSMQGSQEMSSEEQPEDSSV